MPYELNLLNRFANTKASLQNGEGDKIMKWRIKKVKYRNECCWCRKKISDFSPVYGVNARFRKDVETPPVEDEGYVIELAVRKNVDSDDNKPVRAIVTSKDSDAKKVGTDMIFMLCSEECGRELKEIFDADIGFFDSLEDSKGR